MNSLLPIYPPALSLTMLSSINRPIYSSETAKQLLNGNGITCLNTALDAGEVLHRRYNAKNVATITVRDGEENVRIYIKRQWRHARIVPRMHTILAGKALASYPLREWRGLHALSALGLDTAEPLALFRHPLHPFRAAVVTRAVPGKQPLNQLLANDFLSDIGHKAMIALARELVRIIDRIHHAGIGWRSMDIKHFYPVQQEDGSWRIWLIDCEGVFQPAKERHIERERRSVLRAIHKAGNGNPLVQTFGAMAERGLLLGQPLP